MYNTKQEGRWAFQIHVLNIQTSQLLAAKLIFHNVIQSFYCPPPLSKPSNHYSFAINPLASGALFSCPCLSFRASFPLKGFGLLAPQTLPPSKKPSYVVLKSSSRASESQHQEVKWKFQLAAATESWCHYIQPSILFHWAAFDFSSVYGNNN
jgi:hypothetical protein